MLKTIGGKVTLSIISVSAISLIITFLVLFYFAGEIEENVYKNTKSELIELAEDRIGAKKSIGLTNAISIANDDMLKQSLQKNNREKAIASLQSISVKMKKDTEFKNVKVHIHTKNNRSFLRSWAPGKYND